MDKVRLLEWYRSRQQVRRDLLKVDDIHLIVKDVWKVCQFSHAIEYNVFQRSNSRCI